MDTGTALVFWVLLSAIGMGYFIYGIRQRNGIALAAGAALCVYPYFVSNPYVMAGVGIALVALPFLVRL
jgi:hypothetical protein